MLKCQLCSGEMERGYVRDITHGATAVAAWVSGAPEVSRWTGVKTRGRTVLDIVTYRCTDCGYLSQFAFPSTDNPETLLRPIENTPTDVNMLLMPSLIEEGNSV